MIDPRRHDQARTRAQQLLDLSRDAQQAARRGDDRARKVLAAMRAGSMRWPIPEPFGDGSLDGLRPPNKTITLAQLLLEQTIEPLRRALSEYTMRRGPLRIRMNETDYELGEPVPVQVEGPILFLCAPLTAHVCRKLVADVASLHVVVNDPSMPMDAHAERAHFARERTKLIRVEHWLWKQGAKFGGPPSGIPYYFRLLLLVMVWNPVAHAAPGASTLCIRCGTLVHRKRSTLTELPRCATCMKETHAQREWPTHAMAPHDQGRWFLRCQYPDCEMVFTGPRHQKLCPDHTSSRLPPARRLARLPATP